MQVCPELHWFLAWSILESVSKQITKRASPILGGIQVLRHHDFDLFWPTHPPYHQTSSFPIPTLMMTSSFPHTHPPINIFFLSLINKAKIRQGLFLLKKNYILHTYSLSKCLNYPGFIFLCPRKLSKHYPRKKTKSLNYPNTIPEFFLNLPMFKIFSMSQKLSGEKNKHLELSK